MYHIVPFPWAVETSPRGAYLGWPLPRLLPGSPGRCLEALRAVRDWEESLSTQGCPGDGPGSRTESGAVPTMPTATPSLLAAPCPGQQVLCQALKSDRTLKSPGEEPRPIRSESQGWGLSLGEFSKGHWGFLLPTRLNAPAQFLLPGVLLCSKLRNCGDYVGGQVAHPGRRGGKGERIIPGFLPCPSSVRETWSWAGRRLPSLSCLSTKNQVTRGLCFPCKLPIPNLPTCSLWPWGRTRV